MVEYALFQPFLYNTVQEAGLKLQFCFSFKSSPHVGAKAGPIKLRLMLGKMMLSRELDT